MLYDGNPVQLADLQGIDFEGDVHIDLDYQYTWKLDHLCSECLVHFQRVFCLINYFRTCSESSAKSNLISTKEFHQKIGRLRDQETPIIAKCKFVLEYVH